MEGILQVAEGFNDVRLAALGELGARQRRLHGPRPKWRGHRTGDEADEEEDDDEEDGQRRSSLRTVMVLFLCATLFLMHWRVSLSPQLEYIEKKRGHWLYPVKQALDTAACPECFDGSVLIPVLMVLYVWGRVIVRVVGWLLVLGTLVAVSYPPYLCWEHRLPWEYDYGAMCRSVRPQCQAAIDYAEREGLGAGSDGHYAYLWKHGTTGALTQPEITHAKKVRGWQRLGLQKDMLHSALELGFDMPWYGKHYNRVQISGNGYLVLLPSPASTSEQPSDTVTTLLADDGLGSGNSTHECCAPLDSIHTEHQVAVIAPYYTDLDPTIENAEGTSGVWAGQLTHDYSFGIYFNRIAAANSPLEKGNRPNPKHTTSFQVVLTAEGAVKMHYHEANASSHGRPKHDGRGVFVGWRSPVDSSAGRFRGGQLVTAAAGNLTHTVDETIRRKSVLLNGCSIYAVHFTQQELYDRKLYPITVKPENQVEVLRQKEENGGSDAAAEWGDVAEGGSDATSAEGRRRRKEELVRISELQAMKQAADEKDEM